MESDNIEKLLEKYFEATTSVAEEKTLRAYFSSEKVAPHLEHYIPIFNHFSNEKRERFTKELTLAPESVGVGRNFYKWASVAAVAVFCIGFYFTRTSNTTLEEEYTKEEIASAKEAFDLLAHSFSKGSRQLSHLGEFEKNTNRFLIDK